MKSRRLRLIVAYDGTPFAGWQSQKHGRTIQDELEAAFRQICGIGIPVIGAGRTDTGVHALGQSAHVDVPEKRFTPPQWCAALNGIIPRTVRVLRAHFVPATFHARFSAKEKTYRYRIVTSSVLSPFEIDRAWHVIDPLDLELLECAAQLFVGRHDYAGFTANRGHAQTDTVRTIQALRVIRRGKLIELEITGDGFLYKMVRLIVGALVRCATGREELGALSGQLENRSVSPRRLVAPGAGLYLVRVRY